MRNLVLTFILMLCFSSAALGSWKIKLKECAVVKGEWVRLEEIAEPTPYCSVKEWKSIKKTKLWKSPLFGRQQIIDQMRLRELLEMFLSDYVNFCVLPRQMVIQRGGKLVLRDELINMLEDKVKKMFLTRDYRIRDLRIPNYIFLKDNEAYVKLVIKPSIRPGMNTVIFNVFDVYNKATRKIAGSFFLDVWDNVICAAKPLNRGDLITHEDVTFVKKNLAYLPFKVWDGKGGPWRVKRPIGVGRVIFLRDLEPKPIVCKDQKVFLIYEDKFIYLKVPARALEDGRAGDLIKVVNLHSKKVVIARVVDKDRVVVP